MNLPGPFVVDSDLSVARAARGSETQYRISSLVTPGEALVFPVLRISAGIHFGRLGFYAGASIYGDPGLSGQAVRESRYHISEDPAHLATPWGEIGLHPQFFTGFTF